MKEFTPMAHSQDKTMDLATELQQFLDETLQGATDEVSDGIVLNEEHNPESSYSFQVRKDDLIYEVHVIPANEWTEATESGDVEKATA